MSVDFLPDETKTKPSCPNENSKWGCCCKCKFQIRAKVDNKMRFACIAFYAIHGEKIVYILSKHGACELFTAINKSEKKRVQALLDKSVKEDADLLRQLGEQ